MKLKISLKSENSYAGRNQYHNEINANNFKELALILLDLYNLGVPVVNAFKEFQKEHKSDWDLMIGG